ncbi:hypothetical protein EI94DRAFT_1726014 [Lactarius quietus]|nr:hypothetical protein EI94DRAFT_1726014 [Lactarius quietus]
MLNRKWQAICENFPFAIYFLCIFSHTPFANLYRRLTSKWHFPTDPTGSVVVFVSHIPLLSPVFVCSQLLLMSHPNCSALSQQWNVCSCD